MQIFILLIFLWNVTNIVNKHCKKVMKMYFQPLKVQCHKFFASGFFHESSSPKPLKITLGSFHIMFENSRRSSQVKVHDQYPRHRLKILSPVSLVSLILRLCTFTCEYLRKFAIPLITPLFKVTVSNFRFSS
jgi:hypothetical protein